MVSLQKSTRFLTLYSGALHECFPPLVRQNQFNRRVRTLEPQMRSLQHGLIQTLAERQAVHRVLDLTSIWLIVRVRGCRKELFAGQATFGRRRCRSEWVYDSTVALLVSTEEVIIAFGLAPAACNKRPIEKACIAQDRYETYLADKDKGSRNERSEGASRVRFFGLFRGS